ncbi:hypothetical protein ANRL4_03323 [Anaerolineae bacterium]|nr:hypothetical protein ANRL4_03323 [Anaerolineae bacterium]
MTHPSLTDLSTYLQFGRNALHELTIPAPLRFHYNHPNATRRDDR